jgi:hypothetical protein
VWNFLSCVAGGRYVYEEGEMASDEMATLEYGVPPQVVYIYSQGDETRPTYPAAGQ